MAVVFEDDSLAGFGPLTRLRHASQLLRGTKTLLEALTERVPGSGDLVLWGREEVAEVTKESMGARYNSKTDGADLLVNARARPDRALSLLREKRSPFAALAEGSLVAARLSEGAVQPGVITTRDAARLAKGVERLEAPDDALFAGYWDLVESNGLAIAEQARRFEESLHLPSTVEVRGTPSNVRVEGSAEVESHVTFDARLGPIVVGAGAAVESFSRVMGPCYIGPRSRVYSGLIGGGTSVFESCKVGGQVENSVMMPYTNKAHLGYVGDSYLGSWVNLGAGSNFSNLKNTYGNVRLSMTGKRVDSGMLKLGPVIGDMCKVSIGSLVYAGKSLGAGSHLSGLAATDVPSFTYYDGVRESMVELRLDSVLETQRRMMERRGRSLTRAQDTLIRRAFKDTQAERRKARVKKGRLR